MRVCVVEGKTRVCWGAHRSWWPGVPPTQDVEMDDRRRSDDADQLRIPGLWAARPAAGAFLASLRQGGEDGHPS